jgi:hypothetical protein
MCTRFEMLEVKVLEDGADRFSFGFDGRHIVDCSTAVGLGLLRMLRYYQESKGELVIPLPNGRTFTFPPQEGWELLDLSSLGVHRGYHGLGAKFRFGDGTVAWKIVSFNPEYPGNLISCTAEDLPQLVALFPELVEMLDEDDSAI